MQKDPDFWEVTWKFEDSSFDELREMAEEAHYSPQEIVFDQGDPADGMYLVIDGFALVIQRDPNTGNQKTVGIVSQGQSFGELGLLTHQERLGTVAAGTELTVLKISPEQLDKIETEAPHLSSMVYKQLARTLAEQMINRGMLAGTTSEA